MDNYSKQIPEEPKVIVELNLCEASRLVLKPNTLYYFTVDRTCEACLAEEAKSK